ncbi:MAG: arylamine N-acetyltransferase [Ekhidna sp.]|nr:arylamine N-acetyltransferase [Ekhidna sp.]
MSKLNYFQNKPKASPIDLKSYLERIKCQREPPSLTYLKKLQKQHLLHIPFENLDIHYGRKIILDYQQIFKKIVHEKRGGFCHELNGLFYHLLYHLGFNCYIISAKVWNEDKGAFGRPFEHMAIVVTIENDQWYVDVGFGDGLVSPFKVRKGEVRIDYTKYWKLDTDPDDNFVLKNSDDASVFSNKLLFTTDEKQLIQFMEICNFQQTSPESSFTQKKLITQLTNTGRVTLTDKRLKISSLGEIEEIEVLHEDDFLSKLEHHFKIEKEHFNPFKQ